MYHDMFGNPFEELRPLTRESLNELMKKFVATRCAANGDEARIELENEAWHFRKILSYIREFEHDGRHGVYHDLFDAELIPAIYDELTYVATVGETTTYIAKRDGRYGIVKADGLGTVIHPFTCDSITPCSEHIDLCIFSRDGKMGLIQVGFDRCIELLPPIYDSLEEYPQTPYIQLCKDGKVGLYGATLPIPPIYDVIYLSQQLSWIKVKYHGTWGYIDSKGQFTDDLSRAFLYHSSILL